MNNPGPFGSGTPILSPRPVVLWLFPSRRDREKQQNIFILIGSGPKLVNEQWGLSGPFLIAKITRTVLVKFAKITRTVLEKLSFWYDTEKRGVDGISHLFI